MVFSASRLFIGIIAMIGLSQSLAAEVNVYSGRKEQLIKPLLDRFTKETGIKTRLVTSDADKLITRLQNEGRNTPADVLITVDAGRLFRAKQADVLQPLHSEKINQVVPEHLRDPQGHWVGLSQRARVIFYARDRVKPEALSSYENLAAPEWKQRICIRSSNNIYNQSLVASMMSSDGQQSTQQWADNLVKNMARPPHGGDKDQIKAVAAGLCDVAVANTYYFGQMLYDENNSAFQKAAQAVDIFWPNQQGRGAHVNVSGAGITRYAKHPQNAQKLLEFLVSPEAQQWYAEVNYEYPVRTDVPVSDKVAAFGEFKSDQVNLDVLGQLNAEAVRIMDRAGWR